MSTHKKRLFIAVILILAFSLSYARGEDTSASDQVDTVPSSGSAPLDTRDFPFKRTPLNKLGRGIINSATFILEIPASVCYVSVKRDPLTGCTMGFVEGVVISCVRLATGLFDMVTFLIPPYDKLLMEPEYAYESAIDKMSQQ